MYNLVTVYSDCIYLSWSILVTVAAFLLFNLLISNQLTINSMAIDDFHSDKTFLAHHPKPKMTSNLIVILTYQTNTCG